MKRKKQTKQAPDISELVKRAREYEYVNEFDAELAFALADAIEAQAAQLEALRKAVTGAISSGANSARLTEAKPPYFIGGDVTVARSAYDALMTALEKKK